MVLGVIGSGIGIGSIFSAFITAVGRNPEAREHVFTMTMLGFALVEALALFALIIALLLLFVFLSAMSRFLLVSIVIFNFNYTNSAEGKGGMPQLNPESFSSQLFWLFVFFLILYTIVSSILFLK